MKVSKFKNNSEFQHWVHWITWISDHRWTIITSIIYENEKKINSFELEIQGVEDSAVKEIKAWIFFSSKKNGDGANKFHEKFCKG